MTFIELTEKEIFISSKKHKMRKTLAIVTTLLLAAGYAKAAALSGSWKEVYRSDLNNKPLNYTDTFFMTFNDNADQYYYRKGNWRFGVIGHPVNYVKKGDVVYEQEGYEPGSKENKVLFTVLAYTSNTLVIQNNTYIRQFAWFKDTGDALPEEPAAQPVNSLSQMKGHWSEFKRTSELKEPINYTRLIKFMDIFEGYKDGNYGYIFATRDADNNPSWKIDRYDAQTQTLYCSGRFRQDQRVLKVTRCEDNELRLEEDGITYYFRKFILY